MARGSKSADVARRFLRRGHRLVLNPYDDVAFTRCPQCSQPTKVRKVYLVVHVEPKQLLVLNKSCRLCEGCDLLFVKKSELESLMAYAVEQFAPEVVGNDYLVLGTLDAADGRQIKRDAGTFDPALMDKIYFFRGELEVKPAGWVYAPEERKPARSRAGGANAANPADEGADRGPGMSRRRGNVEPPIYRFRVRIVGGVYAPEDAAEVWREIEVGANQTLEALGEAIPLAFEFDDPHLWAFFLSGEPWDEATEYALDASPDPFSGRRAKAARRVKIRDVPFPGGTEQPREFLFLFDFGDEWHFGVTLVGTSDQVTAGARYPRVAAALGEAPPQYPDLDEEDEAEEE